MAAANDTQGGDSFKSPGTGKGPTDSSSPLSQSRGGADPNNVFGIVNSGPLSAEREWTDKNPIEGNR